jgi:hypothetical protein
MLIRQNFMDETYPNQFPPLKYLDGQRMILSGIRKFQVFGAEFS